MQILQELQELAGLKEPKIQISNKESKFYFAGVSLGESGSAETGIAVIDRDKKLVRVDKSFNLSDLKLNLHNIGSPNSVIACVGLPRNMMMMNGKWRIESKLTQSLRFGNFDSKKYNWTQRFSDRGSELCKSFIEEGMDVFRFNCYFTKNMLHINPPFRSRSPAACKYLQMAIENRLGISGMPSNLIPLPAMNAIIGAYTAWKMFGYEENRGYRQIATHRGIPVVTAL